MCLAVVNGQCGLEWSMKIELRRVHRLHGSCVGSLRNPLSKRET